MSYTVLARRYRSTSFGQVVGQEPIAQTLRNAIEQGKVHHAFLFTGTRGVGKTSMARVFSCALNAPATVPDCPAPPGDEPFPPDAVQQRMADAIMRGDDMNVIEIDGASNRSVEAARSLIDGTGLTPSAHARYKIYIIDEVHMLTREAFNTLLKTMEEPPSHVKFILCTTEPPKVPPTIQSRCQRFDFRNIPTVKIVEHLRDVVGREALESQDPALWQVARLANGSMRDALSLLDRLIAAAGTGATLSQEILEQMLGLPSQPMIEQLVDALADGDIAAALSRSAALLGQGLSQDQLVDALIERFRQLMLVGACGRDSNLVELPDDARATAAAQAERFDAASLVYMIALCDNLHRFMRSSSNPAALLDAAIVRLALAEKMADVTALLGGAGPPAPKKNERVPDRADDPGRADRHAGAPSSRRRTEPPSVGTSVAPKGEHGADAADTERPSDAGAVWERVLETASGKASLGWIRSLVLKDLGPGGATLTTRPGRRDLMRFVTAQRREQLGRLLGDVVGRPIRVEIALPAARDDARTPADTDDAADRDPFDLPIVKQVLEHFDAQVTESRTRSRSNDDRSATGREQVDG